MPEKESEINRKKEKKKEILLASLAAKQRSS